MERVAIRRTGGVVFAIALLLGLFSAYVALVYHGDLDAGAQWVVSIDFEDWILIFLSLIGICFLVMLVLLAMRPSGAPTTSSQGLAEGQLERTLTCNNCRQLYIISDTGERPLYHTCPHCGFTDQLQDEGQAVPEATAEPEAGPAPTPAAAEAGGLPVVTKESGEKVMVLRCGACATQFEVPYTEERPLIFSCENCGRRGILKGGTEVPA